MNRRRKYRAEFEFDERSRAPDYEEGAYHEQAARGPSFSVKI